MGLKATVSGSSVKGLYRSGSVKAMNIYGASPPPPPTPMLDFSVAANSMYIPLLFGYQIEE